jgi:hypothetical protein
MGQRISTSHPEVTPENSELKRKFQNEEGEKREISRTLHNKVFLS